jgi:hypothetical protein
VYLGDRGSRYLVGRQVCTNSAQTKHGNESSKRQDAGTAGEEEEAGRRFSSSQLDVHYWMQLASAAKPKDAGFLLARGSIWDCTIEAKDNKSFLNEDWREEWGRRWRKGEKRG